MLQVAVYACPRGGQVIRRNPIDRDQSRDHQFPGVLITACLTKPPLQFTALAQQWREIGVTAERVGIGEGAELELRDRLARYSSPRWYLNQLNCAIEVGLCSEAADALVRQSLDELDPVAKQELMAQAHAELVAAEVFIPLGVPVRWSLVRGSVSGYQANPWGLHPLFPLSQPTT